MLRLVIISAALAAPAAAQTLVPLKHLPPDGAGVGFLLTDGSALFQGNAYSDWWRLTPDINGSYENGTWSQAASLPSGYTPLYFSSAVLADGRVVILGGEYINGVFAFSNKGAVFDPVANTWAALKPPAGWTYIGDSPCAVLPDGRFLVGRKFDTRMAALDPKTLRWTALGAMGKADFNAEEGWTLLPNGQVLTYDVKAAPHAEQYDPARGQWSALPATPVVLKGPPYVRVVHYGKNQVYYPPGEVGPGILRADGTVFATGATPKGQTHGFTAIYDPASQRWTPGPDFPNGVDAGDSASLLLPSGTVLVRGSDDLLYEFDGAHLTSTGFPGTTYGTQFMLPSGEAIISGQALYRPAGAPAPSFLPVIDQAPASIARGGTYLISGRQFNGLSQGASFGDEVETATNYPLVRITITATHHVFYARTHDHSTMGVATGQQRVSTSFDVPRAAETGPATIEVVANGIASKPVATVVQ